MVVGNVRLIPVALIIKTKHYDTEINKIISTH
jgi:hypothetical protein